jgi:hypothetical protein
VRIALASDAPPLDELRALPCVSTAEFDAGRRVLAVTYAPSRDEAEAVIGEALKVLLARGAKISSVSKGRKLEERVLELT